jgi:hypothetical protein
MDWAIRKTLLLPRQTLVLLKEGHLAQSRYNKVFGMVWAIRETLLLRRQTLILKDVRQ